MLAVLLHLHTLNLPGPDFERVTKLLSLYEAAMFTLAVVLGGLLGVLLIVLTVSVARRLSGAAGAGLEEDYVERQPTAAGDVWAHAGRRVEVEPAELPEGDDQVDDAEPWSQGDDDDGLPS